METAYCPQKENKDKEPALNTLYLEAYKDNPSLLQTSFGQGNSFSITNWKGIEGDKKLSRKTG
jgi:hypothetical protein